MKYAWLVASDKVCVGRGIIGVTARGFKWVPLDDPRATRFVRRSDAENFRKLFLRDVAAPLKGLKRILGRKPVAPQR